MAKRIYVVGLGAGDERQLTLEGQKKLSSGLSVFLRTGRHPIVGYLKKKGIDFQSFDTIYEQEPNFETVYGKIITTLIDQVLLEGEIVYAVPGHPMVGESTVTGLMKSVPAEIEIEIISGTSFADNIFTALKIDPSSGMCIINAMEIEKQKPVPHMGNIIMQVFNRLTASQVKLALMEVFADDYKICLVKAAGSRDQVVIENMPLYELDQGEKMDHLTSVYVPPRKERHKSADEKLAGLADIMQKLRAEDGCPWDREQTHGSLAPYLIEEAYETAEAIESGDLEELCVELGDVLMQVVFHAEIGKEKGTFYLEDVIEAISRKMIRRHPHVFEDAQVSGSEEVLVKWEEIKANEKHQGEKKSRLDGVPQHFPALMKAHKLQSKAAKVGFDWDSIEGAVSKVEEELKEVVEVMSSKGHERKRDEIGDLLFAVVNLARFMEVEPETALLKTSRKFKKRFRYIENTAEEKGLSLDKMTLEEMDALWDQSKKSEQ